MGLGCIIGLGSVVGDLECVDCFLFMESFVGGSGGISSVNERDHVERSSLEGSGNCAQRAL